MGTFPLSTLRFYLLQGLLLLRLRRAPRRKHLCLTILKIQKLTGIFFQVECRHILNGLGLLLALLNC